jgi:ABC-type transport system involved in multi-copper enzyme maturation permease subunit
LRIGIATAVMLLGLGSVAFGSRLAIGVQLAIWGAVLLTAAYLLGPTIQQFFGPVLYCDVVRTTRSSRSFFVRSGYAVSLLAILFLMILGWMHDRPDRADVTNSLSLSRHDMAEFGYFFFSTFLIAQYALAILLTPIYAASAITEEKERRTLDFLMATDLRGHEIILSKLASRLAQLFLVVLTGLPILCLLQFLGGVDPNLLLGAFLATGLTMFSLVSIGLVVSVYCQTTWDAVFRTYLVAGLLALVSSLLGSMVNQPAFSFGNPIIAWWHLNKAADPGLILPEVLSGFAVFHVLVALACCLWAILALREAALAQAGKPALPTQPLVQPDSLGNIKRSKRPPVSHRALIWKEMYDEPFGWQGRNPWLDSMVLFGAWIALPLSLILMMFLGDAPAAAEVVNGVNRIFGAVALTFCLLLIGVNAAGRFSREFERQTLDNLLTVPDRDGILFAKWLASILHVRGFAWFFAWLWFIGILSGGLHPFSLLLIVVAGFVYAGFVASLGVWFSLVTRSTLRASIWTLLSVIGIMLGTCLMAGFVSDALAGNIELAWKVQRFQEWGSTAPWSMWALTFPLIEPVDNYHAHYHAPKSVDVIAALVGVAYYAILAGLLWLATLARFRALTQPATRGPEGLQALLRQPAPSQSFLADQNKTQNAV